jgi:glycosyltransferase involved in cell wall biosynthesis
VDDGGTLKDAGLMAQSAESMRVDRRISFVISTYEWPEALDLVLAALHEQSDRSFEIVVADDGSSRRTRVVIERWGRVYGDRLRHVWQPDAGYRRARALNLGALNATGDLLVFLDGDCVPRLGLVDALHAEMRSCVFLAGKRIDLRRESSERVLAESVSVWSWTSARWLTRSAGTIWRPRRRMVPTYLLGGPGGPRSRRSSHDDFVPPNDGYGYLLEA